MTVKQILKYPRTLHLRGSTLQQGDDPDQVSMASLKGEGNFVFEEKADGANAGLSFDPEHGDMMLQSRGHSLDGGGRERQFDIFKSWAQTFERDFREALSTRYVVYGEWMAAKHSEFYDNLPHLFLTYDLYDRENNVFLSTPARARVLDGLPIVPIHVVHEGWMPDKEVPKLVRNSVYKTANWRGSLKKVAEAAGQDPERVLGETDNTDLSEGVYLRSRITNGVSRSEDINSSAMNFCKSSPTREATGRRGRSSRISWRRASTSTPIRQGTCRCSRESRPRI
jgi:hypothetical protein